MKIFRDQPDNWVWKPTLRDKVRMSIGIAILFYFLAAHTHFWARAPHTTGPWGWLNKLAIDVFGSNGEVVLFLTIGTGFLMAGLWSYVRANGHQ